MKILLKALCFILMLKLATCIPVVSESESMTYEDINNNFVDEEQVVDPSNGDVTNSLSGEDFSETISDEEYSEKFSNNNFVDVEQTVDISNDDVTNSFSSEDFSEIISDQVYSEKFSNNNFVDVEDFSNDDVITNKGSSVDDVIATDEEYSRIRFSEFSTVVEDGLEEVPTLTEEVIFEENKNYVGR